MQKILGKEISEAIISRLKKHGAPKKIFAAVLVGDDPSSVHFVAQKEKLARTLGIDFRIERFSENISIKVLAEEIKKIVADDAVGGIIVQLPLPSMIDRETILNLIPKEKDVDVLGGEALDLFNSNHFPILPPAAGTVDEILKIANYQISITKFAVIGNGLLVGMPVARWLKNQNVQYEIFTSKNSDVKSRLKEFDVVISGTGKPNLFSAEDLKENALIIDFGWSKKDGKVSGDFNALVPSPYILVPIHYTPTPGGTGPVLVAKLMENFYMLNISS